MPRIIIYASEEQLNALANSTTLNYLSRRLYEAGIKISTKRENLVYCYDNLLPEEILATIFSSKSYREKPETKQKPKAIIAISASTNISKIERLARKEKIPFLKLSMDDILENSA